MALVALDCKKCGARLDVNEDLSDYTCKYCHTVHERDFSNLASPTPYSLKIMAVRSLERGEFGKAMQFIEQGLTIDPHNSELLDLELKTQIELDALTVNHLNNTAEENEQFASYNEAEQYHLQANFVLIELQTNKQVYGSNSVLSGATPADINLGLQYINRSLELFPNNPVYLNLKALLLWEGNGDKESAVLLLEKAAQLNPRDINIQNNLKNVKSSSCFIATAAYGSPLAKEIDILRSWRDEKLLKCYLGRLFVKNYYVISPPIARFIASSPILKKTTRLFLYPLIAVLKNK
jgi:tetratricopeptide (TPR) repeat protein